MNWMMIIKLIGCEEMWCLEKVELGYNWLVDK